MIRKIIQLVRLYGNYQIRRIERFFYWKYRLSRATIGKGVKITFPLVLEGGGKLVIGNNTRIEKNVNLAVVVGGTLEIKEHVKLFGSVNVVTGSGATVIFEKNAQVLANTIIRNGSWFTLGRGSTIASNCMIFPREEGFDGKVTVGEGSNIGDGTTIDTCDDVKIGRTVAIGPNCIFYTHDHDYKTGFSAAWKGKVKTGTITIGNGAWIGARVTILPGVTIGEKAVVAAGSIVTRNVLPGDVVGGIPAKSIKKTA